MGQGLYNHTDPLLYSSGGWTPRLRCQQDIWGLGKHLLHGSCSFWLPPTTRGLYSNLSGLSPSSYGLLAIMALRHNSIFFLLKMSYFVFLVYNCVCVLWEHVTDREWFLGVRSHLQPVKAC